jgi:hypothetical protein
MRAFKKKIKENRVNFINKFQTVDNRDSYGTRFSAEYVLTALRG